MHLSEIMTPNVKVVHPDASLQEAAVQMRQQDVGMLPVCDGERLLGTVTDRDIVVRAVAEGADLYRMRVAQVMTPEVLYCFEDQEVEDAATVMNDHQVRRLPILDRDLRLVGIVSLGDVSVRTGEKELAGEALEGVSEPSRSSRGW